MNQKKRLAAAFESDDVIPELPWPDDHSAAVAKVVRNLSGATFDLFDLYGADLGARLRPDESPGLLIIPNGRESPPWLLVVGFPTHGEGRTIGSITLSRKVDAAITERLRTSHIKGKQWAQGQAELAVLERVARINPVRLPAENYSQELAAAVLDDSDPNWDEVRAVMRDLFGREDPPFHEVGGFIMGATEIFNQV